MSPESGLAGLFLRCLFKRSSPLAVIFGASTQVIVAEEWGCLSHRSVEVGIHLPLGLNRMPRILRDLGPAVSPGYPFTRRSMPFRVAVFFVRDRRRCHRRVSMCLGQYQFNYGKLSCQPLIRAWFCQFPTNIGQFGIFVAFSALRWIVLAPYKEGRIKSNYAPNERVDQGSSLKSPLMLV